MFNNGTPALKFKKRSGIYSNSSGTKTYEVVSEESSKLGSTSDNGYCFSPMLLTFKDAMYEVDKLGSFDVSVFKNHIDLYGHSEEIDCNTGDTTTYHLRIRHDSPRVINRLTKLIKG